MAITLNLEHTTSFLKEDIKTLSTRILQIHHDMHQKISKGNDFLGWLDLPNNIDYDELDRIKQLKEQFSNLEVLVVVGIGGSYLGAKAGLEFLKTPFKNTKPEIIFAGHHLSSEYLIELMGYLSNKDYAINVISKSGTTTEPALAFRLLKQHLEQKYGRTEASRRIFATTDKKRGALYQLAVNNNYERFVIPDDVGGRYSVFTAVGLLPFVFANIDSNKLLKGALDSYNDLNNSNLNTNIAYQYAATRYLLYKQGLSVEMLVNYEPKLIYLSEWWKQLFGESEGKENKGLFVASAAFTTDLHSLGQYIQQGQRNIFETIISVNNVPQLLIPSDKDDLDGLNYLAGKEFSYVNKQAQQGTLMAHLSGGVPNIIISIDELDEYNLGYLLYFFELSCAMSAYLLDVNPFDQPGVEDYKKNMFALLGKK